MLTTLWVTRLQREHDFVGMHAGSLIVNLALVGWLLVVAHGAALQIPALSLLAG